MLLDPFC